MTSFLKVLSLLQIISNYHSVQANTISCDTYHSCFNRTITCSQDEDCFINCHAEDSCFLSTFVCPSGSYNCIIDVDIGLDSFGLWASSINGSDMNGGNLTVDCNGFWSCAENTFYCPQNGDCIFETGEIAWYTFAYATFKAHPTTNILSIKGKGRGALLDASVYCPSSGKIESQINCFIHTFGSGPDMVEDLYIFAVKSFEHVSLICNYSESIEADCYAYDSQSPVMICGEDLSYSCDIALDDFIPECRDNTSICQDFTFQPTVSPTHSTHSPTHSPSIATTITVLTSTLTTNTSTALPTTQIINKANNINLWTLFLCCGMLFILIE